MTATPATDAQRRLLALAQHWAATYNDDVHRMVDECYAADCVVNSPGGSIFGRDKLRAVEVAILEAAPQRSIRLDSVLFAGDDSVVVEGVVLNGADPKYFSPFCAILTVKDGKVVRDHTYMETHRWPGLKAAAPYVVRGGLGTEHARR